MTLTNERYADLQSSLMASVLDAQVIDLEEIDAFLSRAHRADAIGAVLDPTLYRAGAERLNDVIVCMSALRTFVATVQGVAARQVERAPADRERLISFAMLGGFGRAS